MQITVEDHGIAVTEHAQWNSYFVDFLREVPEATGDEAEDAELDAPKVCLLFVCYLLFVCLIISE